MLLLILLTILIFLALLAARNDAAASAAYDREQIRARAVICTVFGSRCGEALRVAWCESRYRTWAYNPRGGYAGLFQMGPRERRIYGHGPGAWAQSRAAYRYFVASGRDWSPWQCHP